MLGDRVHWLIWVWRVVEEWTRPTPSSSADQPKCLTLLGWHKTSRKSSINIKTAVATPKLSWTKLVTHPSILLPGRGAGETLTRPHSLCHLVTPCGQQVGPSDLWPCNKGEWVMEQKPGHKSGAWFGVGRISQMIWVKGSLDIKYHGGDWVPPLYIFQNVWFKYGHKQPQWQS